MSFREARERRVRNEIRTVRALCDANPGRVLGLRVGEAGESGVCHLALVLSVATAFRGEGGGPPTVHRALVDLLVSLPAEYPHGRPGALVGSPGRLFLGGVNQLRVGPRWLGPACLYREYRPQVHTLAEHVVGAWNILSGRTVASARDSLDHEAAGFWLDHEDRLPFDEGLSLLAVSVAPSRSAAEFELVEVP